MSFTDGAQATKLRPLARYRLMHVAMQTIARSHSPTDLSDPARIATRTIDGDDGLIAFQPPQASGLGPARMAIRNYVPSYSHPSSLVAATHNDGASPSDSYLIASQSVGSSASLRLLFVGSGCHLVRVGLDRR
jgi:hypothetical protein